MLNFRTTRLPRTRRPYSRSGFTLIELVVVMAITSLLAVVAFIGQRSLRDQASFDGGVDKIVQEFAFTRNYAHSNVNAEGPGTDPSWVFSGMAIEFDNRNHPTGQLVELEPHYCQLGQVFGTCVSTLSKIPGSLTKCPNPKGPPENECFELEYNDPGLKLKPVGGMWKLKIIYLNDNGVIRVCQPMINDTPGIHVACQTTLSSPYTFTLVDGNGHSADIQVDTSGFARRLD